MSEFVILGVAIIDKPIWRWAGVATGKYGYSDTTSITIDDITPATVQIHYENVYESIDDQHLPRVAPLQDEAAALPLNENIYERVEDLRARGPPPRRINSDRNLSRHYYGAGYDQLPNCSGSSNSSTYGRIGNTYGRIDVIGHGIGRIERHLSSSCSAGIDHIAPTSSASAGVLHAPPVNHLVPAPENRISKISVHWLLVNKWLPMWVANTERGYPDYRVLDLGPGGDLVSVVEFGGPPGVMEESEEVEGDEARERYVARDPILPEEDEPEHNHNINN